MTTLTLSNESDSLDLNSIQMLGYGVQSLAGVTGFGLPPVDAQFVAGAADGAQYRNSRTQVRDIDIPLDIVGRTQAELTDYISRLARILGGVARLTISDRNDVDWFMDVVRVGGGDYALGDGGKDIQLEITVRAADPYWTATESSQVQVGSAPGGANPFLENLITMPLVPSQTFGSVSINNTGDVPAYPLWTIDGPGTSFTAVSPDGESISWSGTLLVGEKIIIDAKKGTIVNQAGTNLYAQLAAAPKFWSLSPGSSTISASMGGTTAASRILIAWAPRKWMVI